MTVGDWARFKKETGYLTLAEIEGYGMVMYDLNQSRNVEGACWKKPDGKRTAKMDEPVTQVTLADALAYCDWYCLDIPTDEQYWRLVGDEDESDYNISSKGVKSVKKCATIGNVWEWTMTQHPTTKKFKTNGGSWLCDKYTCKGFSPKTKTYVTYITATNNLGFAVISIKKR